VIIRSLADVIGTDRDLAGDGWHSRRLLLADDAMGYSLNDTVVAPGEELTLEYRHHLEACYCIEGEATVIDLATGEEHRIAPGTLYALDRHDRHQLRTAAGVRLVCIFNPPLTGTERHVDGGYLAAE
jgi:L-ectoine synthase